MHRHTRRMAAMAWALLLLLLPFPVLAAPTHIRAELVAEGLAAPGQTVTLAFHMTPDAGWHGYWQNPGDAGFGMSLDWRLPDGAHAGTPLYPVPQTLLIAGLMNHVYESDYAILVPLTLPANARPGAVLPIRVTADWLACTDEVCVPERAELATTLTVAAPGAKTASDPRFDMWRARLPAPLGGKARFTLDGSRLRLAIPMPAGMALNAPHLFVSADKLVAYAAAQAFSRRGDTLIVELERPATAPAAPEKVEGVLRLNAAGDGVTIVAEPGPVPPAGEPLAAAAPGSTPALPLLLLAALAGGLLLNIMPCVFPILSLKALSLARAGESEAHARVEGLAYAAGVIVACAGLGAALLLLRAGGSEIGWAFQLQEPGVVALLLALAVAITANLAGLYEFAVPGFAQGDFGGQGSTKGAFATGLLAAFAATPCTGPFMAAAMGAALLLPPLSALLLFATLGLGIALPFLAVAFVPALRRRLPRPGAWMARFRRWMALPMGLTAMALLWLASRLGGWPFALACAGIALALALLLALAGARQRASLPATTLVLSGLAVIALTAAAVLPRAITAPARAAQGVLPAQPFSDAALATARASGKPVFTWFTADWCLTCKVNEQVAIEREATRDAFAKAGVIALRGDWTRRDPAITRFLTAHGAAGVPLYVWYPAGGGAPQVLPQVLSSDSLVELANAAR